MKKTIFFLVVFGMIASHGGIISAEETKKSSKFSLKPVYSSCANTVSAVCAQLPSMKTCKTFFGQNKAYIIAGTALVGGTYLGIKIVRMMRTKRSRGTQLDSRVTNPMRVY